MAARRIHPVLLSLLAATVASASSAAQSERVASPVDGGLGPILEEAEALLRDGEIADALRTYREAARRADEPSYRILIGLARSCNRAGLFEEAREASSRALASARGEEDAAYAQLETGIRSLFDAGPRSSEAC